MPKNVMKMLKPSPNYGRNDFDLSHRIVLDANFGELVPAFFLETVPKDKIQGHVSDLVRAQPFVTSPFLRAKQHLDVWFVPYNLMWSRFNEFITDKDEPFSSASKDRIYVPSVSSDDLYNALHDIDANNVNDVHGAANLNSICRNLDSMGFAGSLLYKEVKAQTNHYPSMQFNMWRLMAYNLIWYREYRQQYYDDGKLGLPSSLSSLSNGAAFMFNMDALPCDSIIDANIVSALNDGDKLLQCMLQPRYRCWKKDIYTGLMPNSQFGNVSIVTADLGSLEKTGLDSGRWSPSQTLYSRPDGSGYLLKGSSGALLGNTASDGSGTNMSLSHDHSLAGAIGTFDILTLRKKEAIQRWRENALRAGNQIEDNFEAHYGVKPKSHLQVHPTHIASFDAPLNIGDINAQAQTGQAINGSLGDVAGKGIMSFDNASFEFETNDFGVIVGIYSILPEAEYNGNNFDRLNCLLEREDYFFHEYENLGLELVDSTVVSANSQNSFGLGFAPRYFGYKQKHDRCLGNFMQFQGFNGMFRHWCSPKYDVDFAISNGQLPLTTLYVNPSIFNVNYTVDWRLTPQFMVDLYCDVGAIRQMSVSGMPSY